MDLSVKKTVVVFDLDDTLYLERDYVRSGYRYLQQLLADLYNVEIGDALWQLFLAKHPDPIGKICQEYQLPLALKEELVQVYRFHQPQLILDSAVQRCLRALKQKHVAIAIISDGRSVSQRFKLHALGILPFVNYVAISAEVGLGKPDPKPYQQVMQHLVAEHYIYIADNPRKDFVSANKLAWTTIGIRDSGQYIHPQSDDIAPEFAPQHWISAISDLNWID